MDMSATDRNPEPGGSPTLSYILQWVAGADPGFFFPGGVSWHNVREKYLGSVGGSYGGGFGGPPPRKFRI